MAQIEVGEQFGSDSSPDARGGLVVESHYFIRAWIEAPGSPSVEAVLLLNGERYWSGQADRLEHPGLDVRVPRKPCGLWVPLPAAVASPQVVEVTLLVSGKVLATASVDLGLRYHGFVDKVEFGRDGLFAEGWAHDRARPLDPVKLELRKAGVPICMILAARSREDLKKDKIGLGNHAFSEWVRRPSGDANTEDIQVMIAGTEIQLAASDTLIASRQGHKEAPAADSIMSPASAAERTIELALLQTGAPDALIAGVCDRISDEEVLGWAVDMKDREAPVVLDLLINNFVVATTETERFRADIAEKFKCSGYVGFHFEIIPQMRLGKMLNVSVAARKTGAVLSQGYKTILPTFTKYLDDFKRPDMEARSVTAPRGADAIVLNGSYPRASARNAKAAAKGRNTRGAPSVALIVLNRNGSALLDRHLQTFFEFNTCENVEHVIVDHGSTDASANVVERWRGKGLRITLVERNGNYSFSASNNHALEWTSAECLVFCNNDIFFTKDVLPDFIQALSEDAVGAAGIKLLDEHKTGEELAPKIVQHLGVFFNTAKHDRVVHPVEARFLPLLESKMDKVFEAPAVTGAFLGVKRRDFLDVGGFCEGYFYGYEDIDLCLKIKLQLHKTVIVVGSTDALHYRGYSRKKTGLWGGAAMLRNSQLLSSRFGLPMRRLLRSALLEAHEFLTATKPVIAFAVSEASATTVAGDFYTAYELARELSRLVKATIVFLEEKTNWYDIKDIDLLIVMTHNYDLTLLKRPKQSLVTVGWARNWFSDWAAVRDHEFDLVLSSSNKGAETIRKGAGHPPRILRIATNLHRFSPDPDQPKTVDYVFTGSFWGHARDIIYLLDPAALPYTCEVYGSGWNQVPSLAPYAKGFAKYDDLVDIYRRTRVVIDDANSVTKEWGSVNSRVYDAIAAGALVITNSPEASQDGFDGELPFFEDREQLEGLLRKYCGNESERLAKLAKLQSIVKTRHNYALRAQQLVTYLGDALPRMFRIAIKVPCPSKLEAHLWGDYHFARSLARELRALGHSVRLDLLDQWHQPSRLRDDVSICLRGLSQYTPSTDQINICWLISHPEAASIADLRAYDRVYVASRKYCDWLKQQGLENVEVMMQCVDTELFSPEPRQQGSAGGADEFGVLFVGNSRNVVRPAVADAIAVDAPLTVIGSGWEGLLPPKYLLQTSVRNEDLSAIYSRARVVLNDHWKSMAEHGFLSNRLFDGVASGAYLISDAVDGLSDVFGDLVKQYRTRDELRQLIEHGMNGTGRSELSRQDALRVSEANSFRARAKVISEYIGGSFDAICARRLEEPEGWSRATAVRPSKSAALEKVPAAL